MDNTTNAVSPTDEFDLTSAGEPERELLFDITGFERVEKEEGKVRHVFTLQNDELPFPVQVSEWAVYTPNEQAQSIGRGNLRKFAIKAAGVQTYGPDGSPIVGGKILGTLYEDDNGFRRVKRFKKAPEA